MSTFTNLLKKFPLILRLIEGNSYISVFYQQWFYCTQGLIWINEFKNYISYNLNTGISSIMPKNYRTNATILPYVNPPLVDKISTLSYHYYVKTLISSLIINYLLVHKNPNRFQLYIKLSMPTAEWAACYSDFDIW